MARAYLYTLLAVLTWGASLAVNKAIVVAERAGARLGPMQVALWCIAVGWVALLALLVVRGRLGRFRDIAGRGWAVLVGMGCTGWVGSVVLLNIAFARLPLPDAVVINYLHPAFTVAFQGAAFGAVVRALSGWEGPVDRSRRPGAARLAVGLLCCLAGVALIASQGHLGRLGELRSAVGAGAALLAAMAWGTYSNLGRFVTMKPGRPAEGLSDIHTFAAMTFGLAILGAMLVATGHTGLPNGYYTRMFFFGWGPAWVNAWPLLAGMGVGVYALGFTLWLYAMELGARTGEAHRLPPLAYLSPVLAVVVGWAVLREGFGPGFWPGATLIVIGNAVNARGRVVR